MFNKTSMIFKGAPGTGKTHLACALAEQIIQKYGGIGVVVSSIEDIDFAELTDRIRINDSSDRMIIYILDELEKNPQYTIKDSKFLGFLDGASSRSSVVVLATANDITSLPNFLVNRPGRFEKIYEFSLDNEEIMLATVEGILPDRFLKDKEVIQCILDLAKIKLVKTIDHLRFIIQDVLYLRIKKLDMQTLYRKETGYSNEKIGFALPTPTAKPVNTPTTSSKSRRKKKKPSLATVSLN